MQITDSLLAQYAKGNVSEQECLAVRQYLIDNPEEMGKMIHLMDDSLSEERIDNVQHGLSEMTNELIAECKSPLYAIAADNTIDNLCAIRCEGFAVRQLGLEVNDEELENIARDKGWLTETGTLLKDVGRLSELQGLQVSRKLDSSIEDIQNCLSANQVVIAAVDEGELVGDKDYEEIEDILLGGQPDHVVIVTEINEEDDTVTIIDPNTPQMSDTYPTDFFLDAWEDSDCYMISIAR